MGLLLGSLFSSTGLVSVLMPVPQGCFRLCNWLEFSGPASRGKDKCFSHQVSGQAGLLWDHSWERLRLSDRAISGSAIRLRVVGLPQEGWVRGTDGQNCLQVSAKRSQVTGPHPGPVSAGLLSKAPMGVTPAGPGRLGLRLSQFRRGWSYFWVCIQDHGHPGWLSDEESTCQCRRRRRGRFCPWGGRILWRRTWQLTPVFLPGKVHGQRSLAGYSPWGRKELDMTEWLSIQGHGCWVSHLGVGLPSQSTPPQSWTPLGFHSPLRGSHSSHKDTFICGWLPNYSCWGRKGAGDSYFASLLKSPL